MALDEITQEKIVKIIDYGQYAVVAPQSDEATFLDIHSAIASQKDRGRPLGVDMRNISERSRLTLIRACERATQGMNNVYYGQIRFSDRDNHFYRRLQTRIFSNYGKMLSHLNSNSSL